MSNNEMDIKTVLSYLPHRFPFLLIDRVLNVVPGERLTALKNVTFNEPFFPGHFPNQPVMPGVLIIEAIAQATGILAFKTQNDTPDDGTLYYLVGVDKARFKQPVQPGDQLIIDVKVEKQKRSVWWFTGEAKVNGTVVASAELMCAAQEAKS